MKFLKIFLIAFLILMATVGGAAWRIMEVFPISVSVPSRSRAGVSDDVKLPQPINHPSPPNPIDIDPILGAVNILVVGLDEVDGGRRSDAIALAVIDQDTRSIRMLSIPRDSRVLIPGRGWDKINHAYAYGGLELLKETVMNLFNVGIHYFVLVNYDSFPRIVDLLGGIHIDVEKKLVYNDYSAKLFINIPKGPQHMDGKTLLKYVRFRHDPLGDIGRVQRQQKVISLLMEKLKSASIIPKIPSLVGEIVSAVNTDLTPKDALNLLLFANSLPRDRIELTMTPGKAAYIGEVSYWVIDIIQSSQWLAGKSDSPPAADPAAAKELPPDLDHEMLLELIGRIGKIGILNGDGSDGLGKRASQIFQKLGVDVVYTGNARHFDYYTSNVVYPANATEEDRLSAEALARLCGITNENLVQRNRTVSMVSVILGHDKELIFKRLEGVNF
ncbi:MAG: LCP family protein [Synergistaceae bacterium]|nr:LCP family protein [Synergistaceae bacterium]